MEVTDLQRYRMEKIIEGVLNDPLKGANYWPMNEKFLVNQLADLMQMAYLNGLKDGKLAKRRPK